MVGLLSLVSYFTAQHVQVCFVHQTILGRLSLLQTAHDAVGINVVVINVPYDISCSHSGGDVHGALLGGDAVWTFIDGCQRFGGKYCLLLHGKK